MHHLFTFNLRSNFRFGIFNKTGYYQGAMPLQLGSAVCSVYIHIQKSSIPIDSPQHKHRKMGQLSEGVILAVFSLLLLSFSEGMLSCIFSSNPPRFIWRVLQPPPPPVCSSIIRCVSNSNHFPGFTLSTSKEYIFESKHGSFSNKMPEIG